MIPAIAAPMIARPPIAPPTAAPTGNGFADEADAVAEFVVAELAVGFARLTTVVEPEVGAPPAAPPAVAPDEAATVTNCVCTTGRVLWDTAALEATLLATAVKVDVATLITVVPGVKPGGGGIKGAVVVVKTTVYAEIGPQAYAESVPAAP